MVKFYAFIPRGGYLPCNKDQMRILNVNQSLLKELKKYVEIPNYERNKVNIGIAHIGIGGFHRAHQAVFTDAALNAGEKSWGICGIGIKQIDKKMRDLLYPQDYLYTVVSREENHEKAKIIGAVKKIILSEDSPEDVFNLLLCPDIKVISLTITENGYCFSGDSMDLDMNNQDVVGDLKNPFKPRTAIGFITEVLRRYAKARIKPPTILSCDNLPNNGSTLQKLVSTFSRELNPDLAEYVGQEVCFPNTMVDRITPATSIENKEYLKHKYGVQDNWPVFCEEFMQWVIEDKFSKGHPDWSVFGAQFVSDSYPYEKMKLRLLNGSHSALSYVACLAGFRDVDKAMRNENLNQYVKKYMDQMLPTIGNVPGIDLRDYTRKLRERFANRAVSDQVSRLAQDGSRKIPVSMVEPLKELILSGRRYDAAAFALAAWIQYIGGKDETGNEIDIIDPLKKELQDAARLCVKNVLPFFSIRKLFPEEIASNSDFTNTVLVFLDRIRRKGMNVTLREFSAERS